MSRDATTAREPLHASVPEGAECTGCLMDRACMTCWRAEMQKRAVSAPVLRRGDRLIDTIKRMMAMPHEERRRVMSRVIAHKGLRWRDVQDAVLAVIYPTHSGQPRELAVQWSKSANPLLNARHARNEWRRHYIELQLYLAGRDALHAGLGVPLPNQPNHAQGYENRHEMIECPACKLKIVASIPHFCAGSPEKAR